MPPTLKLTDPSHPVLVIEHTRNNKLGNMSTTYVTQATCPDSCQFKGNGCYAEDGFVGIHNRRLNRTQHKQQFSHTNLALMEANGIRMLTGTRRLRAHVVGDCSTPEAAQLVGAALVQHEQKFGQRAWTYTHAWRRIAIGEWLGARVLASCETPEDMHAAHTMGYAVALTIGHTSSRKAFAFHGFTVVPCPAQFHQPNGERQTTCERCNLCSDTDRNMLQRRVVGFQPDGRSADKILQIDLPLD